MMTSTEGVGALNIHICFAESDSATILPVVEWLSEKGITVGQCGSQLKADIIRQARAFVYVVNEDSASSSICQESLQAALTADLPVLVLNPQQLPIPDSLITPLQYAHRVETRPDQDIGSALHEELMKHLSYRGEVPASKPAMPDFSENKRVSLLQHGLVALVILSLGLLTYFMFR
jgi:hypothetical protein